VAGGTVIAGNEITSARSPRVKAARQLARRSARQRSRMFLAEGPQAVREALAWPGPPAGDDGPPGDGGQRGDDGRPGDGGRPGADAGVVTELFATAAGLARYGEIADSAAARGVPVHLVSGDVMAELAQTVTPQGLLAVCRFIDVPLERLTAAGPLRLVVLLANVRDPGNAGTVLRTADAAGADAVVFTGASVDPYNGKCVRSSAGSLFHLPVVVGPPPDRAAGALRQAGLQVLAADGSARRALDELDAAGMLRPPTAWLFGNEAWGLPAELLALADEGVAVPVYGRAESLNLSAAAAVCLYASARAQRAGRAERPAAPA
jgi:RNA methyltransferase, TrmH family